MNRGKLTKASLFSLFTYFLIHLFSYSLIMGISTGVFAEEVPFTLEDRDRLIRLEATLKEFEESVARQFGFIGKQFEQVDKRFEQVDKRFEQVDKRLEFMQNLMIGMLGVFGGLCGIFVGLLIWDRRTFKEKAKEEAIRAVEEGKVKDIIAALREIGQKDPNVTAALRRFNLL